MKIKLKIISAWIPAILFSYGSLTLLSYLENGYQESPATAKFKHEVTSRTIEK